MSYENNRANGLRQAHDIICARLTHLNSEMISVKPTPEGGATAKHLEIYHQAKALRELGNEIFEACLTAIATDHTAGSA